MIKLFIGALIGAAVATAVRKVDVPRELRYLGWSGPHTPPADPKAGESKRA